MDSSPRAFDFVVLGGGSAGYAAARTAAALKLNTAVIDGAEELGGLCILRGCMPSKTLIESANRNLVLRAAAEFGLSAPDTANVNTRFIRDRKRRLIHEFAGYRQSQLQDGRFTLIRGTGRFERTGEGDPIQIAVNLRDGGAVKVIAGTVLVATGSIVQVPEVPGLEGAGYWTSDTILDAAELPPSVVVLGGGAIALEMAHYLEGVGTEVRIIQRSSQLLRGMDPGAAEVVREAFQRRGMQIHCGTKLERVEAAAGVKRVHFTMNDQAIFVEGAEILAALGRRPATDALALDATGVRRTRNGTIEVKDTMQTTHERIFAAGDVCGPLEVVHMAIQQGEVAARNAAALLQGRSPGEVVDYRCKLFGVFTHPQVASVGLTESEARERGLPVATASYPFSEHGKSMVMGETDGFVKLIADSKTGEILGGVVAGPEATELIHEIAVAMHFHATVQGLASAPHYHPTLSEIWTYPAEELAEGLT